MLLVLRDLFAGSLSCEVPGTGDLSLCFTAWLIAVRVTGERVVLPGSFTLGASLSPDFAGFGLALVPWP